MVLLSSNNKQAKNEIRETSILTITSKKYLGINLTKEMQDFMLDKHKTLLK